MKSLAMVAIAIVAVAGAASAKDIKPFDPNKKICRRDLATGSMLPHSVCHTRSEWTVIDQQAAEATKNALDRRNSSIQPNGM